MRLLGKKILKTVLNEDGTTTVEWILVIGIVLSLAVGIYNFIQIVASHYTQAGTCLNVTPPTNAYCP